MATVEKAKKTRKKPRKRILTPDQIKAKEQKAEQKLADKRLRTLFDRLGFKFIKVDGKNFTFQGRTGELDSFFIFENIIVICELTIGKGNQHLLTKKYLYDKILNDVPAFVELAKEQFPEIGPHLNGKFTEDKFKVRIVYVPKHEPSDELLAQCTNIHFLHGGTYKYFQSLVGTIESSARIEFFKFLGLQFKDVGDGCIKTNSNPQAYEGYLLPESNSSYPKGYKIVSFYADPETLIAGAYVLRRDGWRDESHLYQRILIKNKIRSMRKYLIGEKRVFVNNIIVTLPPDAAINEPNVPGKNIPDTELHKIRPVTVLLPQTFDSVGIIDGQHRIFCYYEGTDDGENKIKHLRKQQNLLVTGIKFPPKFSDVDRKSAEAKLFLEINCNQAGPPAALKQDIEVIIHPYSTVAIAKRVVQELGRRGPLRGMLQTHFFDEPSKIKTSSIVSYGLRPIVKRGDARAGTRSDDSLFSVWRRSDKDLIISPKPGQHTDILEAYIAFCVEKINEFLIEVKLAYNIGSWDIDAKDKSRLLSPTAINGLIVCLRKIIENNEKLNQTTYKTKLHNVTKFDFAAYKSSQWKRLGTDLYDKHYK